LIFSSAIFISYALQFYVPIQIIWDNYMSETVRKSDHATKYQLILRFVALVFTFVVAGSVPELGLFISLFGEFLTIKSSKRNLYSLTHNHVF
jgi:solute carrier family 36 (proton-coupled amino acid transporter)